jgi:hypothetical protein
MRPMQVLITRGDGTIEIVTVEDIRWSRRVRDATVQAVAAVALGVSAALLVVETWAVASELRALL